MKHPDNVQGLSAKELADEFMNTTYGYQLEFYQAMVEQYNNEIRADSRRGYYRLAVLLNSVRNSLKKASASMTRVWELCESRTNK